MCNSQRSSHGLDLCSAQPTDDRRLREQTSFTVHHQPCIGDLNAQNMAAKKRCAEKRTLRERTSFTVHHQPCNEDRNVQNMGTTSQQNEKCRKKRCAEKRRLREGTRPIQNLSQPAHCGQSTQNQMGPTNALPYGGTLKENADDSIHDRRMEDKKDVWNTKEKDIPLDTKTSKRAVNIRGIEETYVDKKRINSGNAENETALYMQIICVLARLSFVALCLAVILICYALDLVRTILSSRHWFKIIIAILIGLVAIYATISIKKPKCAFKKSSLQNPANRRKNGWFNWSKEAQTRPVASSIFDGKPREIMKTLKTYSIPMEMKKPPLFLVYARDYFFP